jgi:hypothetical protein
VCISSLSVTKGRPFVVQLCGESFYPLRFVSVVCQAAKQTQIIGVWFSRSRVTLKADDAFGIYYVVGKVLAGAENVCGLVNVKCTFVTSTGLYFVLGRWRKM